MLRPAIIYLILLCSFSNLFAQRITGTVYDAKFDRPPEKANIFIDGTNEGTVSDGHGNFYIEGLSPGKYLLKISINSLKIKCIDC